MRLINSLYTVGQLAIPERHPLSYEEAQALATRHLEAVETREAEAVARAALPARRGADPAAVNVADLAAAAEAARARVHNVQPQMRPASAGFPATLAELNGLPGILGL